jgi:hypothetical protein
MYFGVPCTWFIDRPEKVMKIFKALQKLMQPPKQD